MVGITPLSTGAMTAAIALSYEASVCARILCVGADMEKLLGIQYQLDTDFDFVLVSCPDECPAVLASEDPFDVIISDHRARSKCGEWFRKQLRAHSPDAERIIVASQADRDTKAMAASDGRVMRLLVGPCSATVLREAVSDALLRHRARALRAAAIPRVTPMGGHPCCASRGRATAGAGPPLAQDDNAMLSIQTLSS